MAGPQEMMFQNQLQFNLHVPLSMRNITTSFRRPGPITIERAVSSGQGLPMAQLANKGAANGPIHKDPAEVEGYQFTALSKDRMAMAMQLAQRDLKNQKLQQQAARQRSPSPDAKKFQPRFPGDKYWMRQRNRQPRKVPSQQSVSSRGSKTVMIKEHDRNRTPRSAASQTPPSSPSRMAFINTKTAVHRDKSETSQRDSERSNSPPTRDTPSMTKLISAPSDDIEKLQLDMELCLQQIESVQKRLLSEGNSDFLRPTRSRSSDLQLDEEEGKERRQLRSSEQRQRALRNIYNLQQQLREAEQQIVKMPRNSRATKKSLASQRLTMVNRGAVKLLQAFVSQLPQQDLRHGLPSHFGELANLVRQVTLLSGGVTLDNSVKDKVKDKKLSPVETGLIAMVDQVERLNQDWQREVDITRPSHAGGKQKPPFVTNFKKSKPTKSAFVKEQIPQHQIPSKQSQEAWYTERKAALQAGIQALLKAQRDRSPSPPPPPPHLVHNLHGAYPTTHKMKPARKKIPTRKPLPKRKGYLLSQKVRQQQISHAYGHQQLPSSHFADPTITANLKASNMLYNPVTTGHSYKPHSRSEPASPRDRKKVNFAKSDREIQELERYYASFPGGQRWLEKQRSASPKPQKRRSRSHSPRSPTLESYRQHGGAYSDSEISPIHSFYSSDNEAPSSPVFIQGSQGKASPRRPRSASPSLRSKGQGRSPRRRSPSPKAPRRRFFVADADPEFVDDMCIGDKAPRQSRPAQRHAASNVMPENDHPSQHHAAEDDRRWGAGEGYHNGHAVYSEEDLDILADSMVDEAVMEASQEFTFMERDEAATQHAQACLNNPSLETVMQALGRMEKENEELRRRYCTFKFHDSAPTKRRYQKPAEVFAEFMLSEQPREPPAFEVTNTRAPEEDPPGMLRVFTEEVPNEPLIFTKDSKAYRSHAKYTEHDGSLPPPPPPVVKSKPTAIRPKQLLSMKQTVVERIEDAVERFDYYQRGLKQHLGKQDPFDTFERVADNILRQCCEEVAAELENINSDMAEHIYTSEFLDENGLPLAPPQLAQDFYTDGTASRNLRDSAIAQRSVEAAVSRTVGSLMLPPDDAEFPLVSPKRVVDKEGSESPPWEASMKHVFDATALYKASVTEKHSGGKGKGKDDTQVGEVEGGEEYEYDDDYTDISDEEEDEVDDDDDDDDDESESPSP